VLYNNEGGMMSIKKRIEEILKEVPENVTVIAATKTRTVQEILEAIEAGIDIIGENYVQEAEQKFHIIGRKVRWHLLGHLQKNKVEKAMNIFDMVETVDNMKLANMIDKIALVKGIVYPVLVEVNSGREPEKSGVFPEAAGTLIIGMSNLQNIKVQGLMTMGPLLDNPQDIRPYFKLVKELFEQLKGMRLPGVEMKYLSMGMSDTWRIAIEEGANIIRLGTTIFGPRKSN